MTAIVGIKDDKNVYLFGDRGASDSDTIVSMTTPKIWQVSENIIAGYAGSGGLGQMIQYMKWPTFDGDAMESTIIDNKLDNLIGVLKYDLEDTKQHNTFNTLFDFGEE